jgi:hypothetical protein
MLILRFTLLLIADHPEQVRYVRGDHNVADEDGDPPARQQLIHCPKNESGGKKQALQQRSQRRLQLNLKKGVPDSRQRKWKSAQPGLLFGRHEWIRDQKNTGCEQGKLRQD